MTEEQHLRRIYRALCKSVNYKGICKTENEFVKDALIRQKKDWSQNIEGYTKKRINI